MGEPGELIFVGAEAEVRRARFLGVPSVRKRRLPKAYRHPALDERIRHERTRAEAQLLAEASAAGLAVPRVLDVDEASATLELEAVAGEPLRVALEREGGPVLDLSRAFGRLVGRLHGAGLVHGDLTTSNVLVREGSLVLVDFGLAQRSQDVEDRGVDLHLVERTFESSHAGRAGLLGAFVEGYRAAFPGAPEVLARMEAIKARGRYA